MPKITSRGLYVPPFRISTGAIRDRWGGGAKGVQAKAVQAKDDDSLTLAIRAAKEALDGRESIDALFFATSTPVYELGTVTPFLVEALGFDDDTYVQQFGQSSRAGTAALRAAQEVVAADGASVLVVTGEAPQPTPRSDWEKIAGAGAAAAVVEADGDGLVPAASTTCARPLLDEWQAPGDDTRTSGDDRFVREIGYIETVERAVDRVLSEANWTAADIDTFVVNHPNGRYAGRLATALGFEESTLATPDIGQHHGNLGAASALASLASATLSAGSRLVLANYGSGVADALAYNVGQQLGTTSSGNEDNTIEIDYVEYLEYTENLG